LGTVKPRRARILGAVAAAMLTASIPSLLAETSDTDKRPRVELAILLDTSGSMEGLIEQAKGQLWKVVNEFIHARQNGVIPEVHVALFEYGKSSLPEAEGYLRMIQPLSNDLDRISEELFALKTNGGNEYCGWVIREAVQRLAWSDSPEVYRAIFVAGNEPFTQGPVDHAQWCKAAIAKGIVVNTIYCGDEGVDISSKWREGALLADGKYMTIDHNRAVVHFEAPQDQEIVRLSSELNRTYTPYGALGAESAGRQAVQDANALALAPQGVALNRALTKASVNYQNSGWDLVDAVQAKTVRIEEVKTEDLPEEMRGMTLDERQKHLDDMHRQRAEIQARIQQLNEQRNQFVAAKQREHTTTNTLDSAVISAIREQAAKRNYQFE